MADVLTLGEMLIDFVPLKKGVSVKDNPGFLREPGGAPANVAVGIARLGRSSAFLGKFGEDFFGDFLIDTLKEYGVDTSFTVRTGEARTTLAFVVLDEKGERDFSFYRDPGADMLFRPEELKEEAFQEARVLHFGSISLIDEPVRTTTLKAVELARKYNCKISYDPNLRPPLWPDLKTAREWIIKGLKAADIVKISEEELEFITGEEILEKGAAKLLDYGIELLLVTLGDKGSYFNNGKEDGLVSGYRVAVEDTTGAGDGFMAGVLYKIISESINEPANLSKDQIVEIVKFANAVGAIVTTRKGAIKAMPGLNEVKQLITSGRES
jgi:sugar/nucleoside kinase (ribokinase family)